MINAAIVMLFIVAAIPPVAAGACRLVPRWAAHPLRVDAATVIALLVTAAIAAGLALPAGIATGTGRVLAHLAAVLAAVIAGGPVVRAVLAAGGAVRRRESGGEPPDPESTGPLRGGRVIGYLERLAVAATLLAGWPEGLAVILAVKSLARFPELRAPHASEQFIMGTFASVLWACAMVGVGFLLLT